MNRPARILVVDDDPGVRFFLEEVLTRDGHRVVAVEDGKAALEQVTFQEFDLALIDLRLSDMGGMEVLAALRDRSPGTVVIVLTGHASLETAVEALRRGAHDYLFKPCKTVELRESVRAGLLKRQRERGQQELLAHLQSLTDLLEEMGLATPQQIVAETTSPTEGRGRFLQRGGLIVDIARHTITLDGHILALSPTEFDLLAYLISEAPRVVSPQELVREVQGYESEPWEARDTVRSYIYRIRQKIKSATGRTDVIRTVRGVGYTIGG